MAATRDYLQSRVKVNGKTGNLSAGGVAITEEDDKVVVRATGDFSKRYLKYLAKRYLKSIGMRDLMRVVATEKNAYAVKILASAGVEA